MVVVGVTQAFQGPAYASALATMVSKAEYPKASGALSLADGVRGLVGPALAAVLYPLIGLSGVLVVDALTFVAAFGTLLFVKVPQPPVETAPVKREGWLERASFGFRYILTRPSLFGLMLVNALFNFAFGIAQALQPALILARGGEGGEAALAAVRTAAGAGGILSGLALSAWGAPRRRINGFLGGMLLYAFGLMLTGIGQNALPWVLASLTMAAMHPLIGASSGAIWQAKVAPALQGRVLAARQTLGFISSPLGTLLAGADRGSAVDAGE
ncbi:MAG: MFS transporter [Pleurocapsa sp. SU_196_0]|nr:MFS transporter [Pleurocapsa sp. SU_196_0]